MSTTNVIQDSFRLANLRTFINSVSASTNYLYMGLGRPQPWTGQAPTPLNSGDNTNTDWEDLTALKLISGSDLSYGISREIWKANTKYDIFRNNWGDSTKGLNVSVSGNSVASLSDTKYFAITSVDAIFVCIKQGTDTSGAIIASVYEPGITGNGAWLSPISGGAGIWKSNDGYYWKYIGNAYQTSKFRTTLYEGVTTLSVAPDSSSVMYNQYLSQTNSANYKAGIYTILVTNGGSGYNGGAAGTISQTTANQGGTGFQIIGNGTGLAYSVTFTAGGVISSIEITSPGSGFSFASIVTTSGTGATFDIVYTPEYGLGTDPVRDLSSFFLIVNTTFTGEGTTGTAAFFSGQGGTTSFSKINLIMNPKQFSSPTSALTAAEARASYRLIMGSGSTNNSFAPLDQVEGGTSHARGIVVQWSYSGTSGATPPGFTPAQSLDVILPRESYTTGSGYTYASTRFQVGENINGIPINSISNPDVLPYSGDILYSENKVSAISHSTDAVTLSVIIQF